MSQNIQVVIKEEDYAGVPCKMNFFLQESITRGGVTLTDTGLTVGTSVLLPLHLLLVLLQLLVGQLVEGVRRLRFWWHRGLADWGLGAKQRQSVAAVS